MQIVSTEALTHVLKPSPTHYGRASDMGKAVVLRQRYWHIFGPQVKHGSRFESNCEIMQDVRETNESQQRDL